MAILLGSLSGGMQPSAPTIGTATAGDASASVAFTPSTYIGKGTITYTATSSPGGLTATGASSPLTVSGLTNGTAYTFTVVGTTNYGVASVASAASNSITPAAQGDYFSIASSLITTNTASVTFTNGGAWTDYKHLQLRVLARSTRALSTDALVVSFNGNFTSSNYAMGSYYGSGTAITAFYETTSAPNDFGGVRCATIPASTVSPSGLLGGQTIDILDWSNSNTRKVLRGQGGYATNGDGAEVVVFGGMYNTVGAITSIRVKAYVGDLVPNTRISLYGIKG